MIPLDSPGDYICCTRLQNGCDNYTIFFTKINAFTEKKKYSRLRVLAIFKKQPAEWASPDMELVNSSEPRELLAI